MVHISRPAARSRRIRLANEAGSPVARTLLIAILTSTPDEFASVTAGRHARRHSSHGCVHQQIDIREDRAPLQDVTAFAMRRTTATDPAGPAARLRQKGGSGEFSDTSQPGSVSGQWLVEAPLRTRNNLQPWQEKRLVAGKSAPIPVAQ